MAAGDDESEVAAAAGAAASGGASSTPGGAPTAAELGRIVQLTGLGDPIYAEARVEVRQYDIALAITLTNRTSLTLQNVGLELATLGDLKLAERPAPGALGPGASRTVRACVKVASTETGAIFGSIVFDPPPSAHAAPADALTDALASGVVVLNDVHVDVMDYISPGTVPDGAFRGMWAEFEWENKVAVSTTIPDAAAFLEHVAASTNMAILTPPAARAGKAGFLAANLYARSVFGEDALVNVAVEEVAGGGSGASGGLAGAIRIRSKTQGIALALGDKLILKQKG